MSPRSRAAEQLGSALSADESYLVTLLFARSWVCFSETIPTKSSESCTLCFLISGSEQAYHACIRHCYRARKWIKPANCLRLSRSCNAGIFGNPARLCSRSSRSRSRLAAEPLEPACSDTRSRLELASKLALAVHNVQNMFTLSKRARYRTKMGDMETATCDSFLR